MRRMIEISAAIVAAVLAAMAFHAWLASHDEQLRMQATITTQKQLLDAADAREHTRATVLDQTLAEIQKLKRDTQTPSQILSELPKYLTLPQLITMAPSPLSDHAGAGTTKTQEKKREGTAQPVDSEQEDSLAPGGVHGASIGAPQVQSADPGNFPDAANQSVSASPSALIPAADLKPLYDYVQDCRACQAHLAAAKQNSADDAAKLAAMTRERDAAAIAAKGGTFWRRFRRNIEWFAIGAAAGAVAVCGSGHCR
jgi:hypothetical protein